MPEITRKELKGTLKINNRSDKMNNQFKIGDVVKAIYHTVAGKEKVLGKVIKRHDTEYEIETLPNFKYEDQKLLKETHEMEKVNNSTIEALLASIHFCEIALEENKLKLKHLSEEVLREK